MATRDDGPEPGLYRSFLGGIATWFLAWGMQTLLFQWLVVEGLHETPARVGLAQTSVMLPALPVLLLGGALADRTDRRRLLIRLHAAQAALLAALAGLVVAGALSFGLLIAFGLATGTVHALTLPARDSLLSDVARGSVSRAVVGANLMVQAGQTLGVLLAGGASVLGAPAVLALEVAILLLGALPLCGLPRPAPGDGAPPRPRLLEIAAGAREVARSAVLLPVLALAISVGLCFIGTYLVLLPLLVRDHYGGGGASMGVLLAMLPAGGIAAGAAIFARGGLRRNGIPLLVGQAAGALCILALALGPSFPVAALCVLGWGVASAFFMNAGRTLFQQHATPENRGRVLSLYALGFMGPGLLGSLLAGVLADAFGVHAALAALATAMLACVSLVAAGTGVAQR